MAPRPSSHARPPRRKPCGKECMGGPGATLVVRRSSIHCDLTYWSGMAKFIDIIAIFGWGGWNMEWKMEWNVGRQTDISRKIGTPETALWRVESRIFLMSTAPWKCYCSTGETLCAHGVSPVLQ